MQVHGGINPYESFRFGFGYIDTIQRQRAVTTARHQGPAAADRDQSIFTRQQVMRMREAVQAIKPEMLASQEIQIASPAMATSASSLNLDMTVTATKMQSTEEVNTTPTSYSTHAPEWTGSTAQVTLSGEYDGSNGSDTLTLKVTRGGTHGTDDLQLKVYDSNNDEIDKIDIRKNHAIGRQYTLDNGLVLTLSQGDLIKNDTFTMDVEDASPTSYSPAQPNWVGSNALPTIGGVYDGSNGTGTLTFRADKSGTHGEDDLTIKVYDATNNQIDTIDIKKEDPIDKQYALSNGLTFTLGDGDLLKNTTFTMEVFDSVGSAVDPDNPFNGKRADDPNLEPGLSVSDGSFQINGTTIDVHADDTLNSVLDRITQSDAGVSATFDAATETVLLTQNTAGSTPDIILANDTAGFLAAVKLDGATATPGEDSEPDKALAEVASFAAVQSGSISVNGVSIDIDINTDSLNDVLDRISASAAGVDASFDSTTQRVTVRAESTAGQMELYNGATQFFAAVGISEGAYNAADDLIQAGSVNVVDVADRIVDAIVEENAEKPWEQPPIGKTTPVTAAIDPMLSTLVGNIASAMNTLFDDSVIKGSPGAFLEGVRNDIRSAVSSWSGSEGSRFNTDFGINFDFEKTQEGVFQFSPSEQQQFEAALATPEGAASVRNALFGQEFSGLFSQLHASLTASAADLESEGGPTGLYLDISI